MQRKLDDHFGDVTFYIHEKQKTFVDELKYWANAKVVISSTNGLAGNEIWLQKNSILIILQNKQCFTETVQMIAYQGIEVYTLFYNSETFGGVWYKDIFPTIEKVLINNHVTMKNKVLNLDEDNPDDIF